MKFRYTVKNFKGESKSGTVEAANKREAQELLLAQDLIITSLSPLKKKWTERDFNISFGSSVSLMDKILFARHLTIMIKGGVSLRSALVTIREQVDNPKFAKVLDDIIASVENGQPLAKALSRHPKIFDGFYVNMIKIGEESGSLRENLEHLASHLERVYELNSKIKGAMIYPIIILTAVTVMSVGITLFVLPKIMPLFRVFDITLPLATRILIAITEFLQNYGLFLLVGGLLAGVASYFLSKIYSVKFFLHRIKLNLPIFGSLHRDISLAYFAQNLGTLLRSGVPVVSALDITQATIGNLLYKKELAALIEGVKKGRPISDCLEGNRSLFPVMIARMIAVGEKTGNLEETLLYMSEFYGEEVIKATDNLSTILEPALMIAIGLVVGFVALAIISPIYELTSGLQL
ncbi:MAG: hypothetical protein GF370_04420 [Candidatus Nealsonbacteria bacterium]|nr:hypothetical protein [Candidatus Nealsonbacteria bacterium]